MAKFSDLLYELRKEKNLTQTELAEKLGITNKAVSKWETGEAMPDTAQLLPLAEILGVSVDELLRGERIRAIEENDEDDEISEDNDSIHISNGKDTIDISSRGIFVNGEKSEHPKATLLERICGCVCASLIALSVITYVLLGYFLNLWHPLWCIPASAALGCGIVGCAFELFDRTKREEKRKKGENPYTGCACGIIMLASIIVFLCVASVLNLWNIMWICPAVGACACIVIGAIGGAFGGKKED